MKSRLTRSGIDPALPSFSVRLARHGRGWHGTRPLRRFVEQLHTPPDRAGQRAVPDRHGPAGKLQQAEPAPDPGQQLLKPESRNPRRGQFQSQRQPVEPDTDLGHRSGVCLGQDEVRSTRLDPGHEQRHARRAGQQRDRGQRPGVGDEQGLHREQLLAGNLQRRPAGRQHPQPAVPSQQVGDVGRRRQHMLHVVQHDKDAPAAEVLVNVTINGCAPASRSPSARATAGNTAAGSVRGAKSTKLTPSGCASRTTPATAMASRVFPAPPVPTNVRSRTSRNSALDRASSPARPTSGDSGAGSPTAGWAVSISPGYRRRQHTAMISELKPARRLA